MPTFVILRRVSPQAPKAVYIRADQPVTIILRLRQGDHTSRIVDSSPTI